MTIKECIDIVDDLKPNQYSTKVKVMWLSFIDEIIINDVLKTHKGYDGRYDDFTGYSEDKLSVPLIVASPYDRLYTAYLKMKIDAENGETARYNNSASLFNSYLMEYKKFYNKTHMPLSEAEKRAITPVKNTSGGISEADLVNLEREIYAKLYEDLSGMVSDDKLYSIVSNYVINNIEMLKENRDVDLAIEGIKTDLKSKADLIDGKVPLSQLSADSIYNPESHNPQSGVAVKEALQNKPTIYSGTEVYVAPYIIGQIVYYDTSPYKVGDMYFNTDHSQLCICKKIERVWVNSLHGSTYKDAVYWAKAIPQQAVMYDPESYDLQTGVTVAEALKNYFPIMIQNETEVEGTVYMPSVSAEVGADGSSYIRVYDSMLGDIPIKGVATPADSRDAANKGYVDSLVGDINEALESALNGGV